MAFNFFNFRCAKCRAAGTARDCVRVYLSSDTAFEELSEMFGALKVEAEELKNKVGSIGSQLEKFIEDRSREGGARIKFGETMEDSLCYNCESTLHRNGDCPNQPYIR